MTEQQVFNFAIGLNHSRDEWLQLPPCRLCANVDKSMVSIYSEDGKRMALAYKINKLLPFTVSPQNKLPLVVCQDCITELNTSMNFIQRCMENQAKLRKLLNISVEDCDYETQEIYETKDQRKSPKRRKITKVVSGQGSNNARDEPLEDTSETIVVNNDQGEEEIEIYEVGVEKHSLNVEYVDIESQEGSVLSSSEAEVKTYVGSENNDGIENVSQETKSLDNGGEGATVEDSAADTVTKGSSDLRQFCKFCDAGFVWKADLFTHQIKMHPDLVFRCCFCQKVFYDKNEFYSHELAHRKLLLSGIKGKLSLRKLLDGNHAGGSSKALSELLFSNSIGTKRGNQTEEDSTNKPYGLITNHSSNDMEHSGEIGEKVGLAEIPSDCSNEKRKRVKQDYNTRLSCHYCPRTFSSSIGLKKHEVVHQEGKKGNFHCKICDAVFVSNHLLKKHSLRHSSQSKFQCEICLEFFNSKNEVEEHIQTHAGESSYLCEECGLNVDSFVMFRLHKLDHLQNDYYKCNQCQKSFSNATSLKNHELTHSKKKKCLCKVCGENFSTSDLLKEHKLSHEGEDFKCEVCNKSFTGYKKLRNHIQTHSVGRNYLCEKCGKDFKSNSSLHKHRYLCQVAIACTVCDKEFDCNTRLKVHMRVHTGEKPFVCSVCGKGFHASWSLSQHSATHTTVKIPCPLCGALFNRKSNMLTHKKRHRVPCGVCGKVFASIPILLSHQKSHDDNANKEDVSESPKDNVSESPKEDSSVAFRCEQCGKLFMTTLDLKAHMSTHSNVRPYRCNICGKSWRLQKTLKKHMVMHSGRKPYQCRYCTCTFLLHQRLVKHENGHTAGKPFTCQDCGQSFWTQLNLEKHTIRHCAMKMVDQKYTCKVCDKNFETKSSLMSHKRSHSHQPTYCCSYCPRKFSQLRYAQRHKCALDPNNQARDSSVGDVIFKSLPSLAEEESCSPDENTCPSVLNEEVVYDMDSVSSSYAEIIVISQGMDDIMVVNNDKLDNSA